MNTENIFTAINTVYIGAGVVAIGFLLAYIANKVSDQKPAKK